MRVKFFTDDGRRIDEDGGADFIDQAAAELEALKGLSDWIGEQEVDQLPFKAAVVASNGDGKALFRLTIRASIDRFDGQHIERETVEVPDLDIGRQDSSNGTNQ